MYGPWDGRSEWHKNNEVLPGSTGTSLLLYLTVVAGRRGRRIRSTVRASVGLWQQMYCTLGPWWLFWREILRQRSAGPSNVYSCIRLKCRRWGFCRLSLSLTSWRLMSSPLPLHTISIHEYWFLCCEGEWEREVKTQQVIHLLHLLTCW